MSTPTPPPKELLTVEEAAEYLTLSRKSIDTMIRLGELAAVNVATRRSTRKAWRLRKADLEAFLRQRRQRPIMSSVNKSEEAA